MNDHKYVRDKNEVLVIAAHPDDEVLGCGGTIARHIVAGDDVHIAIFSLGMFSRITTETLGEVIIPYQEEFEELRLNMMKSIKEAHQELGVKNVAEQDFYPDQQFDTVPILTLTKEIEILLKRFLPNIVYTHFLEDVNEDHRVIARATITACRPKIESLVHRLLFYEVPSSTEWMTSSTFSPNYFVDIYGPYLEKKLKALEKYSAEMRDFPHPRSVEYIESLAKIRGAAAGLLRAESFMLGREIVWG